MGLEEWELEAEAGVMLGRGNADPYSPPNPARIAATLGLPVIVVPPAALPCAGALVRVGEEWRIYVRARLSREQLRFTLAHELAEWRLKELDYRGGDVEQVADRLGAAILAPRQLVRELLREDRRFPALARALRSDESLAALRAAEVTGEPTALVSPRSVRVRGEPWGWPGELEIRRLARAGSVAPRGVRRVRLRDDPARVVIRAE
jgi:hypothetical protein